MLKDDKRQISGVSIRGDVFDACERSEAIAQFGIAECLALESYGSVVSDLSLALARLTGHTNATVLHAPNWLCLAIGIVCLSLFDIVMIDHRRLHCAAKQRHKGVGADFSDFLKIQHRADARDRPSMV